MQNTLIDYGIDYGSRLLLALLLFFVGKWLIKKVIQKIDDRGKDVFDKSLKSFVKSISKVFLYILLIITIAATLGIEMSSFIAIFGAAAFAVGFALQGSLANFAGGILILTFRPFNVGDFIEISEGLKGEVKSIQILYTRLLTRDNRKVIVPNGKLANNNIINYNDEENRRVDLVFAIGYDDDLVKAKELLNQIVLEHNFILKEPKPLIRVAEHADSSININCFVWCKSENYWNVYYDLMEEVKLVFDEEGINIPYPQMDVHLPAKE